MFKILSLLVVVLVFTSCSSIGKKSWGSVGSSDAFDIKTSYDPKTGSVTPEIVAGGGTHVMLFALPMDKDKQYPTMWGYSSRQSLWGIFGGTQTGNISMMYVSGSNETPEQTIQILDKIKSIVNKNVKNQ